MTSKNKKKLYISLFYVEALAVKNFFFIKSVLPHVDSLERSRFTKLGNTGKFFKKLAFVGLAYNNVLLPKGHNMTLKSAMLVVWNAVAAYTFIF